MEAAKRYQEALGALIEWSHVLGADLRPPGADTYGEGVRDSKATVRKICARALEDKDEVETEPVKSKINTDFLKALRCPGAYRRAKEITVLPADVQKYWDSVPDTDPRP